MSDQHSVSLLAHAEELERRDDALAAAIETVVSLLVRSDGVRARAAAVLEAISAMPGKLARNDEAEHEARQREGSARRALAEAESRAEETSRSRRAGDEERAQAQRELVRAQEQLADAEVAIRRAVKRREELLGSERALCAEGEGLVVRAHDIATEIRGTPRVSGSGREQPGSSLSDLVAWGGRVHAALFVVRGGLESERERVVVEANTLGTAVIGEQLAGTSVRLVRRRLEGHLGST